MTSHMHPGMPERGSYDDLFKQVERRLRALEVSARLPLSSIGEGGITVQHGGQIVFLDAGGDVLTTLDSSGLVIGSGVVIDEDGLYVDGILQPALAVITATDTSNADTTSTLTTVNEVTINPPSWANEVTLYSQARLQARNVSGAQLGFDNQLVNAAGHAGEEITDSTWTGLHNTTTDSFMSLATTLTSSLSSLTVQQQTQADSGSHQSESRLEVLAVVRRV